MTSSRTEIHQGYPSPFPRRTSVIALTSTRLDERDAARIEPSGSQQRVTNSLQREPSRIPDALNDIDDLKIQERKMDEMVTRVVYIDPPEEGPCTHRRQESLEAEPEFVQNTIFYDPFKDRRINAPEDTRNHPRTLLLSSMPPTPGPSSSLHTTTTPMNIDSPVPSVSGRFQGLLSNSPSTTNTYQATTPSDDGFRLPPIPVTDYPEPPPAYTEVDLTAVASTATQTLPTRAQVLLNHNRVMDSSRKYMECHHCGMRVYSMVLYQVGSTTHIVACLFFMFALLPLVLLVYWFDFFKHKNHYCPCCNKLIAYETSCSKMVFVK